MAVTVQLAGMKYKNSQGQFQSADALKGDPTDVQINGTSIVSAGVATIPVINGQDTLGVCKVNSGYGLGAYSNGYLTIISASDADVKSGGNGARPITCQNQHTSAFYGLAKAAGDTSQASSSNAVGAYTDDAKVAIQKMLGIYEAPWELIREDTFTNSTSVTHEITVDGNASPFELTDAVLMFETPVQETASSNTSGLIVFTDGTSNIAGLYLDGWTQAANATAHGIWIAAENKNGLVFVYGKSVSATTNTGYMRQSYNAGFSYGQAQSIIESADFVIRGAKIAGVTGTGHYKLYGRRKWTT